MHCWLVFNMFSTRSQASRTPDYGGAWGCPVVDVELCTCPCWISQHCCWSSPPTWWGPPREKPCPLVYLWPVCTSFHKMGMCLENRAVLWWEKVRNNTHKSSQCLGFFMHGFSCKTKIQPWSVLIGVAQENLVGTLEEQLSVFLVSAAVLHANACYFHFSILTVALDAVLSVQYPPIPKYHSW